MTKRISVLFLIDGLAGGTGRVFLNLIRAIDRKQFSPLLGHLGGNAELLPEVPSDVPVVNFRDSKLDWRLERFRLVPKLAAIIRRRNIALVLSALETSNIFSAVLRKILPSLRVILSYHVNLSGYQRVTGGENFRFFGMPMTWYVKRLYPWADVVVSPSRGCSDDLVTSYGLPAEKSRWIHNPIDLAMLKSKAREPLNESWLKGRIPVLTASGTHRWVDTKGFDLLVQALHGIPAGRRPRLLLIGEGPQKNQVEALIDKLGLSPWIRCLGYQANPWKYISRSDLFVCSSRFETFSLVLAEAMAVGTPVLSADCDYGPREIIEQGRNGRLVPPENPMALAGAIQELLSNCARRVRLRKAGLKRSHDFDLPSVVHRYESLFQQVLGM